jgi:DNA polymerase-3 subunit alpha
MSEFVHLHVHTQYSLLDGLNRTEKLLKKVKDQGMNSVAVTDHGVMYGIPEFWKMSKDFDVKPIIGVEAYLAPTDRKLRSAVDGIKYYHLLLLAKNLTGYKNLIKLVTAGHIDGMYYRPRVDVELLKKHHEGLICTSACLAGPLATHIVKGELKKAEEWLQTLHGIFGEDFYLEVQRNGICSDETINEEVIANLDEDEKKEQIRFLYDQITVNKQLYKFGDQYKIPVVATTDAHYLNADDKDVQEILFAVKDGRPLGDPQARKGYIETYIKSSEEMSAAFSDMPEVLENTLKIDEKIEKYSIKFDRVQPKYWNLPKNTTAKAELERQTWEGAKNKYGEITPELKERIDYELMVIDTKGYNDYFLVVGDLMQFARSQQIVVGVRGSAAGSVVSYSLDITNVDPIKWGLVFERFLNLERDSPPDIDMDIQDDRREELIDYARLRYGETSVAGVITFGSMATKAAIRDVARVMGIDLKLADRLSKMVTVLFGKPFSFNKMMETDEEFKNLVDSSAELTRLGGVVQKIEGLKRQTGVHAAGYLITPQPLDEYMAYQRDNKDEKLLVSQIDGTYIDKLDFMKFDFLGLRTLTILKNTIIYIEQRHGIKINLQEVNVNPTQGEFDQKALDVFRRGDTVGVFQFESPPMQEYLKQLKPRNLEDICFMAAAYRPGPMEHIPKYIAIRNGKHNAEYIVPELEPILSDTLGFPVYQEQLLKICQKLGGFTLGDGDVIRNALKKKQLDILQVKEEDFKKYFLENYTYGEEVATKIWGQLKPFADYGFNKAHAASYAAVAYWCAYLKGNYPLEFAAALMHSDLGNSDRITVDIMDAERMGFEVLPPDINQSGAHFEPLGDKQIVFGLGAVKNVGVGICEAIVAAREQKGAFTSLDDFVQKVGTENLNRKAVECLIKVGAMDAFGPRNALLAVLPIVYDNVARQAKVAATGQIGMFGGGRAIAGEPGIAVTPLPKLPEITNRQLVLWEKELIGIYLSTHPLDTFFWLDLHPDYVSIEQIPYVKDGTKVQAIGSIEEIKVIRTKADNKKMAFLTISGKHATCEGVIFPGTYETVQDQLEEAVPVVISGMISHRNERLSIMVDKVMPTINIKPPKQITINICGVHDRAELELLKPCFDDVKGEVEVKVKYGERSRPQLITRKLILDPLCVNRVRPYLEKQGLSKEKQFVTEIEETME